MEKPFYVTDGMNKIGPFTKEEVLNMLYNAHISLLDYIVDSRDGRMCPLLQHEDFGGEGSTHSITRNAGIAGLTPENLDKKYGFGDLRKKTHKEREEQRVQKFRQAAMENPSHLKRVIDAKPELSVGEEKAPPPTPAPAAASSPTPMGSPNAFDPDQTVTRNTVTNVEIDEETTTSTLKTNSSVNFFLKVKNKEYGPLKFLILLSLFGFQRPVYL